MLSQLEESCYAQFESLLELNGADKGYSLELLFMILESVVFRKEGLSGVIVLGRVIRN